ncbi:MAG: hypothetical protein IJH53_07480 [Oscillospiraceae bacterium]|nr:hypothetical protein [Oscillospiraceae bacterium]
MRHALRLKRRNTKIHKHDQNCDSKYYRENSPSFSLYGSRDSRCRAMCPDVLNLYGDTGKKSA